MIDVQAAVLREKSGRFELERLSLDEPREGEVLVRIAGVGICHTDLTARAQMIPFPLPAVLGHEGSGIVEAVGPAVTKVKPGDHVVLTFGSCGQCENCRGGSPTYCSRSTRLNMAGVRMTDGKSVYRDAAGAPVSGSFFAQSSFASHALATERNVVRIDRDVPVELMGPLGCGIQTGAGTVMNVLKPAAGSAIAIFGAGSVGLSAVMAAYIAGCAPIVAIDVNDERLALAKILGATHTINGGQEDAVAAIRAIAKQGVNYTIECTANPKVLRQAVESLRPRGTCALVGLADMSTEVSLNMNFLLNGRTLRGVMEGDSIPDEFIPKLVDLWRQSQFPFDRLVKFYKLSEINEAVADASAGRVLKPILLP